MKRSYSIINCFDQGDVKMTSFMPNRTHNMSIPGIQNLSQKIIYQSHVS